MKTIVLKIQRRCLNQISVNILPGYKLFIIKIIKAANKIFARLFFEKEFKLVRLNRLNIKSLNISRVNNYILAPDEKIELWSSQPSFYYNGKPTRNARLHYICRNISNEPLNKFIDKDIQATLEFINIFQQGTHSIDDNFTPQQLIAIKTKAETTLRFILEIEFSVNQ